MESPLTLAVVGLGRIGRIHAQHVQEIAAETGTCRLAALVDLDVRRAEDLARRLQPEQQTPIQVFGNIGELISSGLASAALVSTPTAQHREIADTLIGAGQRVLMEKPLTASLEDDRACAAALNQRAPNALMLAFQRRFDEPLRHVKRLVDQRAIGRPFKIVSILEDSRPAPEGYNSSGLLVDMSVHNVDEILWLTGEVPEAAVAIGSRLYSHRLTTVEEDFDDGLLYLWFEGELTAQIQVSRNHVPGYRVETWIFGEEGNIHVGHFEQKPLEVVVEAYGRENPIERKIFQMRDYGYPVPEFVNRFGPAYKAEVAYFVEQCLKGESFAVNHNDGLRAMEVIDAGIRCSIGREAAGRIRRAATNAPGHAS